MTQFLFWLNFVFGVFNLVVGYSFASPGNIYVGMFNLFVCLLGVWSMRAER